MTKSSKDNGDLDAMIIGGGPAGLTAFMWCTQLGLATALLERKSEYGGQLLSIYNVIANYPGRQARSGAELCRYFLDGIEGLDRMGHLNATVQQFDARNKAAILENGDLIRSRAVVVATGVRRRKLRIKGESEFEGRGILESGAKEKTLLAGKRIAIIGGGDAALENALSLGEVADKVYVIHRRDTFRARAEFLAAAEKNDRIEFLLGTEPTEIRGNENVDSIAVYDKRSGQKQILSVDAVLIRVGVEPNTDLFRGQLDLDENGYILVNSRYETSVPFIFAAGDVANPIAPTISTATGMAATAAKAISYLLNRNSGL